MYGRFASLSKDVSHSADVYVNQFSVPVISLPLGTHHCRAVIVENSMRRRFRINQAMPFGIIVIDKR